MKPTIHETIRRQRIANRLSQRELAERLGVSYQAVSKWENAVSLPDVTLLPALARALGITLDQLFGEGGPGEDGSKSGNNLVEICSSERLCGQCLPRTLSLVRFLCGHKK